MRGAAARKRKKPGCKAGLPDCAIAKSGQAMALTRLASRETLREAAFL